MPSPPITSSKSSPLPWVAIAGIVCITIVLLRWVEGQQWWCACGGRFLWVSDVWTNHCSRHLADAYTFTHFSHGLIFFAAFALIAPRWSMGWRLFASVTLASGWEVLENSSFIINRYRDSTMSVEYLGDAVLNSLGDIAACVLGFFYAWRFGVIAAMVTFVLIEIALMFIIRDNLTVGTLMLVFPIDAIKQWQMAGQPGG